MMTGGKADGSSKRPAKPFPHLRGKLGTSIRDDVEGYPMNPEHMVDHQLDVSAAECNLGRATKCNGP